MFYPSTYHFYYISNILIDIFQYNEGEIRTVYFISSNGLLYITLVTMVNRKLTYLIDYRNYEKFLYVTWPILCFSSDYYYYYCHDEFIHFSPVNIWEQFWLNMKMYIYIFVFLSHLNLTISWGFFFTDSQLNINT